MLKFSSFSDFYGSRLMWGRAWQLITFLSFLPKTLMLNSYEDLLMFHNKNTLSFSHNDFNLWMEFTTKYYDRNITESWRSNFHGSTATFIISKYVLDRSKRSIKNVCNFSCARSVLCYSRRTSNVRRLNDFIIQSAMVCSINIECKNVYSLMLEQRFGWLIKWK